MSNKTIDSELLVRMLMGGAACLVEHKEELNALNVFPVADGDTGTNMLCTMEGGLSEIKKSEPKNVGATSGLFARGVLLGARGNSGVILSQIFAGINEGLEQYDTVGAKELAAAYRKGIERSYAAVQNPTEGTILTVFRESTEYAADNISEDSTVEDFFRFHIEKARRSLEATKELLPVLAEADVVDSGAAGYLSIAEGMYRALGGEDIAYEVSHSEQKGAVNIDLFTRDSVLEFGYCTEFLLRLTTAKVDPDSFDINTVTELLAELGGESVVAYKQDDIVKVHVHTFNPGEILLRMQAFGEFLTVKVENMSLGHSEEHAPKLKNNKKFSVVAVASGDGISALFGQMGADRIVSGGQTANPSIEEFIEAFDECDTENIIVLPNNKNIILAARAAADAYDRAKVYVVGTKNLMQGYGALSVISPVIKDMDALVASAERAAESVIDGEVTKAVRDATVEGREIKKGEYIAISEGKIAAVANDAEAALTEMLENVDTDLCEIITLFVGKEVSADRRAELVEELKEKYDECEIVVYEGGQDIYDYLVALE